MRPDRSLDRSANGWPPCPRGGPLYELLKGRNAQIRAIVEHPFHVIDHPFVYCKGSSRGIAKIQGLAKAHATLANCASPDGARWPKGVNASAA